MHFLPIVEREARAVARQPQLYGWRLIPIALAVWLILPQYLYNSLGGNLNNAGYQCFSYLVWLMEFMAIFAAWPACNGIAKERREGTLGFLFLTDLKGIDVVLGKTTTFALGGAMVMLGMVPVLTITLLMGGVTGGEVARSATAVLNTLFFSIAIGLWSASRFTDILIVWKKILCWMGLLAVLPVCLNIDAFRLIPFILASPFGTLLAATDATYAAGHKGYWLSLGMVQLEGWVFFYLAHRAIGNTWRSAANESWKQSKTAASMALGDREPIAWLAGRQPWQKQIVWTAVGLALLVDAWGIFISAGLGRFLLSAGFYRALLPLFYYGSMLLLTWAVCRFFVENRANGSMELLSVTPLGGLELIQLYWQALQNQLRLPVILIVAGEFLRYGPMPFFFQGRLEYSQYVLFVVSAFVFAGFKLFSLYAICWIGMYMACRARSLFTAVAKTFFLVVIAPMLVQTISTYFSIYMAQKTTTGISVATSFGYIGFTLAIYGGGIYWARKKLVAMRPHEVASHRLRIFDGLNREWLNQRIHALRRWQAD